MTKNNFNCPYCGGQLHVFSNDDTPAFSPGPQWKPTARFESVANGPNSISQQSFGEWQKMTPVGRLAPKDVWVAFLDSTIVFLAISGPTGVICHLSGVTWLAGPFMGFVFAGLRYLWTMGHTQGLLTIIETWRSDPPEPGRADPGRQAGPVVSVEIREGKKWKFAQFGLDPEKLIPFAGAILEGASMTEREGRKYGITQEELGKFRQELIDRGLAYWNNPGRPQQGITVRHSGLTVLQAIIDSTQQHAAGGYDD